MGKVAVVVKVMPEDMTKFEEMKGEIIQKFNPYKVEEQPVAFGIIALSLTFIVEDGAGGADLIEEELQKVKNVSAVEVVSADRL